MSAVRVVAANLHRLEPQGRAVVDPGDLAKYHAKSGGDDVAIIKCLQARGLISDRPLALDFGQNGARQNCERPSAAHGKVQDHPTARDFSRGRRRLRNSRKVNAEWS